MPIAHEYNSGTDAPSRRNQSLDVRHGGIGRRNIGAGSTERALGIAVVVLHIDDDQRRPRGID